MKHCQAQTGDHDHSSFEDHKGDFIVGQLAVKATLQLGHSEDGPGEDGHGRNGQS